MNYRRYLDGTNLPRAASYSANMGAENQTALQVGNFPNPFNPETLIRFYLHKPVNVRLAVYDVNGRPVGSGVYFYELRAGNEVKRGRMTLLR